jgi:hypothetical protein
MDNPMRPNTSRANEVGSGTAAGSDELAPIPKKFSNISITFGNFPIIIVTCMFLTAADAVRLFTGRLQLPTTERFW